MSIKLKVSRLAKLATFATVLSGMTFAAGSASATPFTWSPSGSSPSLSTAGAFTADSFSLSDFAHIHIDSTGAFTETGILQIGSFKLGASTVTTPGLNGTSGATSYRMYATFSGAGGIGGWSGCAGSGFCFGSFSSLTYDLWGDQGGAATFGFSGLTPTLNPHGDTQIHLASGSLLTGCGPDCLNAVTLLFSGPSSVSPGAFVSTTFTPDALQAGFFLAPAITLNLQNSFTNTTGVTSITNCSPIVAGCKEIKINNGGGNANFFTVPEPGSLLLLGTGLIGWAGASRRKARARA